MKLRERNSFGRRIIWVRIILRLATWYDRIDPTVCWGSLAMWAMGVLPFRSLFLPHHPDHDYWSQGCRAPHDPFPYCGKCGRTGRFWLGCPPEKRAEIEAGPGWPPWSDG